MALGEESRQERVMVFMDLRNINLSQTMRRRRDSGWTPDFPALVKGLVGSRRLLTAYAFDTLSIRRDGFIEGLNMVKGLRYQGFRVVAPADTPDESGEQKEADVMLATELLMQAFHDSYETAIVVSGDRDFIPAIKAVQSMGKKVEAAAFRGDYTQKLQEAVDRFHVLDDVGFMVRAETATKGA
jgi:uncharacterized LabA/DUF88 family protein